MVGHVGEGRPGRIGDGQRRTTLSPSFFHDGDEIGRLAGLRDPDHQRAVHARWGVVACEQGRRGERDRHAIERAEDVLGVPGRVVRRAARGDHHMPDRLRAERPRDGVHFTGTVGEQLLQPVGLLGDFV